MENTQTHRHFPLLYLHIYNNVHARTRKGFPNGERTFHSATLAHDDTRHAMLKKLKISPSQPSCEKLFLLLPIQNINENLNFNPHKNMKLGIIRCQQTEDYCPGSGCFKAVRNRKGAFAKANEDIEIIGFANCGGCPGKKAVLRAKLLVERGADTIAFASCIQKGTPIGYPCPFHARMKKLLQTWLPENIRLLDYTHDAPGEKTSTDNKQQERD